MRAVAVAATVEAVTLVILCNENTKQQKSTKMKTIKGYLGAAVLVAFLATAVYASNLNVYDTTQAADHIGAHAIVYGVVSKAVARANGAILIDLDGVYPTEKLTVVVVPKIQMPLSTALSYLGKTIYVRGFIKQGPEVDKIVVYHLAQIKLNAPPAT